MEIQWIGRSNQDITGPALEGGEQLDILDNFSYDKSTDRYLDITDMMNGPALGQEDMTVAESILPVLNLANAQGQEKAGLETDKYYGVQMFPWVVPNACVIAWHVSSITTTHCERTPAPHSQRRATAASVVVAVRPAAAGAAVPAAAGCLAGVRQPPR